MSAYRPGSGRREKEGDNLGICVSEGIESFGCQYNLVLPADQYATVGDEVVEKVVGRYGVTGRTEWRESTMVVHRAEAGGKKQLVQETRYLQIRMCEDGPWS